MGVADWEWEQEAEAEAEADEGKRLKSVLAK